jgi:hypothetical protein
MPIPWSSTDTNESCAPSAVEKVVRTNPRFGTYPPPLFEKQKVRGGRAGWSRTGHSANWQAPKPGTSNLQRWPLPAGPAQDLELLEAPRPAESIAAGSARPLVEHLAIGNHGPELKTEDGVFRREVLRDPQGRAWATADCVLVPRDQVFQPETSIQSQEAGPLSFFFAKWLGVVFFLAVLIS